MAELVLGRPKPLAEIVDRAVMLYRSGITSSKVGALVGKDGQTILNWLHQRGETLRPGAGVRKFPLKEDMFDVIDTEDKAYWIGFIIADGNVHENRLQVTLARIDKEHLLKLRAFLNSGTVVNDTYSARTNTHGVHWGVRSDHLSSRIRIISTKDIPHRYVSSFMCGLVDGDGYVGKSMNKYTLKYNWELSLVVQEPWESFSIDIFRGLGVNVQTRSKRVINELRVSGRFQISRILNFLISHSGERLTRKKLTYQQLLKEATNG
jgi:hypothetical protein